MRSTRSASPSRSITVRAADDRAAGRRARAIHRATPEPAPPEAGGWLRRMLPFLMAHKRNVFIAFGVSILGQSVAALTPIIEKTIVDDGVIAQTSPLAPWLFLLIAAGLFGFAASFIRRYIGGRVSLDVQY